MSNLVRAQTFCEGCGPHESIACSECGYAVEAGVLVDDPMVERGAEAIDDLLLQLGVEPTYAPEHAPLDTVMRVLSRAVLRAALEAPDAEGEAQ